MVIEAGGLGGLAGAFKLGDSYLEKFYHYSYYPDIEFVGLCREFGLDNDILWSKSRSAIFSDGELWPLETPVDFLRFKPLGGLRERLMMVLNLARFVVASDWKPFDKMTCEEFFRRYGSIEGYKNLWEPLLKIKFGRYYNNATAAFLWGRVHPRAKSRKKGTEVLGYLKGGYQRLFESMAEDIKSRGGSVHLHERVRSIIPGNKPKVTTSKGEYECDRVIWTASNAELAGVVEGIDTSASQRLGKVDYVAAISLIMVNNRRIGDFFWVNILDKDSTFGIVIEHTNLVPEHIYGGKHIMYMGNYVNHGHPYLNLGADELFDLYLPSLKRIYPSFSRDDVDKLYLFKNLYSTPVYDTGYADKMPPFRGLLEGIDMVGISQVYPPDRSIDRGVSLTKDYTRKYWALSRTAE